MLAYSPCLHVCRKVQVAMILAGADRMIDCFEFLRGFAWHDIYQVCESLCVCACVRACVCVA